MRSALGLSQAGDVMRFGQGVLLLHPLLALMAGSAVAATSEPIGSTVVVVNRVTAEIARDIRTLQTRR